MAAGSKFTEKPVDKGGLDHDALMKAAVAHDTRRIRGYLTQGADPNAPDPKGRLPLHAALRVKDGGEMLAAVEALLKGGADPNRIEQNSGAVGRTAFLAALASGCGDKVLEALLCAKADPTLEEDAGLPSLHFLAMQGRYGVLTAAHAAGTKIDRRDGQGRTCLMSAAREGFAKTVEALLECGADPSAQDAKGFNVLHHARAAPAESGKKEVIRMLTRAAAEKNLQDELRQMRAEVDTLRDVVDTVLKDGETGS